MFYWVAYFLVNTIGIIFFPRTVFGKEHIPRQGSFLVASNHISNLDPFLIGLATMRRTSYMAKDSLFRHWFLAAFFRGVEAFPVRRGASDARALRETLRRLKRGLPVVLFPEGTRKGSAAEKKIQSGVGFLAVKGNVPVLPVYIDGADKVLPPGSRFFRRHRVTITFGKPLFFTKNESYPDIAACIMKEIQALAQ